MYYLIAALGFGVCLISTELPNEGYFTFFQSVRDFFQRKGCQQFSRNFHQNNRHSGKVYGIWPSLQNRKENQNHKLYRVAVATYKFRKVFDR